jgi:hypothetical protein
MLHVNERIHNYQSSNDIFHSYAMEHGVNLQQLMFSIGNHVLTAVSTTH